tara:strand:+ start:799 stop:1245 length:447 start_codon:yes stop_codon:yes gene_type:complete
MVAAGAEMEAAGAVGRVVHGRGGGRRCRFGRPVDGAQWFAHLEELRERDQTLRIGLDLQPGERGLELIGEVAVLAPRVAEPLRRRLQLIERDAALAVGIEEVIDRDVLGEHLLLELQLVQVEPAGDGAHPPVGLLHRVGRHHEHLIDR